MYKKILTAINEHLNSEISAQYALHLAKALGSKLYICFVAEKHMSQHDRRSAEDAMKRLFNTAMEMEVQAESIAEIGNPVEVISRIVRHEGIGLAFASTRRQDIQKRFFTGTIARSLSLKLPCSVALVRVVHSGRVHPRKIMVPLKARIDHVSERAFFVSNMSHAFSSKVFLFHTPKSIRSFFHGEVHLTQHEWELRMSEDISHFMDYLKHHKIEYEGRLLPGKTSRNITVEAFSKRHDLIIMGASERGMLRSLMIGNPVEDVLRETPCDLIMLKPRHED